MLVTFSSKASGNVTMFGDVAKTLLEMMGHSGTVPSALQGSDVSSALARLEQALDTVPEDTAPRADADDDDTPPPVGLRLRAHPLIEMLSAAAREGCDVMWTDGEPSS